MDYSYREERKGREENLYILRVLGELGG